MPETKCNLCDLFWDTEEFHECPNCIIDGNTASQKPVGAAVPCSAWLNGTHLWKLVKAVEEEADNSIKDYGSCQATMLVNYGKNGKCRPGLLTEQMNLLGMICKVFEYYETELRKREAV